MQSSVEVQGVHLASIRKVSIESVLIVVADLELIHSDTGYL